MSEMSVEVQVGSVVVDAASVAHASRHKHGGLDPIATETPGAYAIPKADATGKLAAGFIPMGLISGGISTLDDLSDGSSYKRIAAAVATALNALETPYGAIPQSYLVGKTSFNSMIRHGAITLLGASLTDGPFGVGANTYYGTVYTDYGLIYLVQKYIQHDLGAGGEYIRTSSNYGETWGSWYKKWNSLNDGNGGQPPAPKPNQSGITYRGQFQNLGVSGAAGSDVFLPNPEGGSTWAYFVFLYDATTGAVSVGGFNSGVGSGGSTALSGSPNKYGVGFAWRIA